VFKDIFVFINYLVYNSNRNKELFTYELGGWSILCALEFFQKHSKRRNVCIHCNKSKKATVSLFL